MAGSSSIGGEEDNPVMINATAMVDVIFCLCLFYMCSFHFKQLEGKIETWLPRGGGSAALAEKIALEEIRIVLEWDARGEVTARRVGNRPPAASDAELMRTVRDMASDYEKLHKKDFPVLIQAGRDVPWKEVVRVMDLCKRDKLERIEFAAPPAGIKTASVAR